MVKWYNSSNRVQPDFEPDLASLVPSRSDLISRVPAAVRLQSSRALKSVRLRYQTCQVGQTSQPSRADLGTRLAESAGQVGLNLTRLGTDLASLEPSQVAYFATRLQL